MNFVRCDRRDLGGGRKKPLTGFNANHRVILNGLEPNHWFTVLDVFFKLKEHNIQRAGQRIYWLDSDVQNCLSDLVGWGFAKMQRVPRSRKFVYQFVKGHNA